MSDHPATVEPSSEPTLHVDRWEGIWIRISLVLVTIFVIAVTIAAVGFNIVVPGVGGRVNPNTLDEPGSAFANPGVRELAPGKYEVHIVAQAWAFSPNPIIVPEDAEVTFYVTSRDIQHGFKLVDTNINMMVLPGQISTLSTVFHEPGTHNIICHEYCGIAHHTMYAQLIVEPAGGVTGTVTSTVTSGVTETVAATVTTAVTASVAPTATGAVTATGTTTATGIVTGSAAVTTGASTEAASPLTTSAEITSAVAPTATNDVTAANGVTASNGLTATGAVTATATVTK